MRAQIVYATKLLHRTELNTISHFNICIVSHHVDASCKSAPVRIAYFQTGLCINGTTESVSGTSYILSVTYFVYYQALPVQYKMSENAHESEIEMVISTVIKPVFSLYLGHFIFSGQILPCTNSLHYNA